MRLKLLLTLLTLLKLLLLTDKILVRLGSKRDKYLLATVIKSFFFCVNRKIGQYFLG